MWKPVAEAAERIERQRMTYRNSKERTAVLEKPLMLKEDMGLIYDGPELEIEVSISYSFWPDSYGVRGSEFTNGEPTGFTINGDTGLALLELMVETDFDWSECERWIHEKMHSEEWMSEAQELAFNDCYEDFDDRDGREWR